MKNKRSKLILALIFGTVLIINSPAFSKDNIPKGWIKAGSEPHNYEVGVDSFGILKGKHSAYLVSINPKNIGSKGFGTLMQTFTAKKYLGKRIKMSGFVKTENVTSWTGLWLRIDGISKTLGFDNMQNRAIKGSTKWTKYDIVLDVPKDSHGIAFGILLGGQGKVWLDNVTFETVNNSIKTTNMN